MSNKVFLISAALAGVFLFGKSAFANSADKNTESEAVPTSNINNGSGIPASHLDWSQVQYFKPDEFHGQLDHLDSNVVLELDALRGMVGRIMVSPAPGAVARFQPGSQHDMTNGRLSLAIDIMPLDVSLADFYKAAQTRVRIGGVGLYPDWLPHPGAHIDLRDRKPDGSQATWSGLKIAGVQQYRGIQEALA